jgi:hypothetical protein
MSGERLMQTYAGNRRIFDADSHVIELDDFLHIVATPSERLLIPPMNAQTELLVSQDGLDRGRELFEKRQADAGVMAKFEASLLDNTKSGWNRIGAFDPLERSHALDLFGFERQWVLSTFAFHQIAHTGNKKVLEVGARVLNRAMGQFCASDERLDAVGYIPLSLGPEIALQLMKEGFDAGCYTFMIDTNEPDNTARSFTHPDFDPIWAEFQRANVPFVNHVAVNGDYKPVPDSFDNNSREGISLGGDAPAGEVKLACIGNSVQVFLAAMIFDGVFDRHPNLRAISMEHGGFWLPSWLRSLEFARDTFKHRRRFDSSPIELAMERIKVSPFAGEPIGWIIDNSSPDMLCFASDFPHPEGTGDPIGKFEATMTNCDAATMDKFYRGNLMSLIAGR